MVHIFFPSNGRSQGARKAVSTLVLALVLGSLGGCASVPPPDTAMNQAQTQLQAARDAGAADYAPVDLGFAQNKFQQAQSAMASRDYDVAASLAEEAQADAELARAKARLGAARAQIQAKTDANNQLREQIEETLNQQEQQAQQAAQQAQDQQNGLPPQQQTLDMPAPSSSALQPLPQGQGFETLPQPQQQPQQHDQGGNP
ncbi:MULTISPECIES: DUF4398 domain-containing protein [Dyella]|uniref:DUF4398 domain-containing protein n=2 Tax=Dyella TaxID=231454 RepID=A0A4R0Z1A7_9GAMM|nr:MULTISPECIES: DUF4398 domain-containing protein [Dyella]TBR40377.1 DUF4398 domain-containing protein [Dyella terrae]TCI12040.1 DUF4398 domain-containing protein [Dyella soli]